jgi:superfamily II DNA or RNA helicase
MNRDERQTQGLNLWKSFGYQGIACYPTGFGKTYTAIRAIKGMISRGLTQSAEVIVPTIELKNQWEKELKKHKIKIAKVTVINTAIKSEREVDFLVLDEIHRYAAHTFKEIFEKSDYQQLLGLTATLEREDGEHELILDYAKVFDTITMAEALENGWVAPYEIYNIAVSFNNEEEEQAYKKADKGFKYAAMRLGYGSFQTAQFWMKNGTPQQKGIAGMYFNSMRTRKKICLNNSAKIQAVQDIADLFPSRNGLIFSATTEFADKLQEVVGDIAMTFHSKLKKKEQEEVIKKFKDKRTKIRFISSVKALNEGFNVPDCSLGIHAGGDSTKRSFIQQLGRTVRKTPDKKAIFCNLYTPGTQEESWLKKKLDGQNKDLIFNMTLEEFKIKFYKDE